MKSYSVESVVHVTKRGGRGLPIVKTDSDRYRFLQLLHFLNDQNRPANWERDVQSIKPGLHFERPVNWVGDRDPYVNILAYCLVDNHFHMVIQERVEEGIPKFLQSVCGSMSVHFNQKYNSKGSIFQGRPYYRVVETGKYLTAVLLYVSIKNSLEALNMLTTTTSYADIEKLIHYKFSSLYNYVSNQTSPILDHNTIKSLSDLDLPLTVSFVQEYVQQSAWRKMENTLAK